MARERAVVTTELHWAVLMRRRTQICSSVSSWCFAKCETCLRWNKRKEEAVEVRIRFEGAF